MKKRILLYILAVSITAQSGCLRFFAEDEDKCEVTVDYIYHLNDAASSTGDFSLTGYGSGFFFTDVPVDKEIVNSDCPNYDEGVYTDTAESISYDPSTGLYILLVDKDAAGIVSNEVTITGNFETGAAFINEGTDDEQELSCIFDFDNQLIHIAVTRELKYVINYDD